MASWDTVRWSGFWGKSGKASRNFAITVGLSKRKLRELRSTW
jgi:hypothetical protein